MSTINQEIHKSHWGYHPCSRKVCEKLKKAHLSLLRAFRDIRAHERWERGKGPKKEPSYPCPFSGYGYYKRSPEGDTRYGWTIVNPLEDGFVNYPGREHFYGEFLAEYRRARRPVEKPEDVQPLKYTEKEVDEIIRMLEHHYE